MELNERKALEKQARKPLGQRIDEALTDAGYVHGSASKLARAIGVAPNTIYRMRRGAFAPSAFTLASLAKITGKPMEWFVADFQHPPLAVFREWRRTRPEASAEHAAQLEAVDLEGVRTTLTFYDVALASLSHGSTIEQAIAAAKAVLRDA